MNDLFKKINKSFLRLSSADYSIDKIRQDDSYGWAGDWEGRALLAFVRLYQVTGKKIPCADEIINHLPKWLNERGYMGEISFPLADEQQLSGHSWLLRGLTAYYRAFNDERVLTYAKNIVEGLYLPLENNYAEYPLAREKSSTGGVSGNSVGLLGKWKLSSDIGCAFIALDGLSDYYALTADERVKNMLNRLISRFMQIDLVGSECQTHATLSATRGIIRFYRLVKDKKYFDYAAKIYQTYLSCGMTLTYENFNWFNRKDSWTEPCAVVDSFIVAAELFRITGDEKYKTLAARIWFNGLNFCQRDNGGAGPNTCVTQSSPVLSISLYEAPFCCTMRYAEGLYYAVENRDLLDCGSGFSKDEYGRLFLGNVLLVTDENGAFYDKPKIEYAGKTYIEIPSFVKNGDYKLKVTE